MGLRIFGFIDTQICSEGLPSRHVAHQVSAGALPCRNLAHFDSFINEVFVESRSEVESFSVGKIFNFLFCDSVNKLFSFFDNLVLESD